MKFLKGSAEKTCLVVQTHFKGWTIFSKDEQDEHLEKWSDYSFSNKKSLHLPSLIKSRKLRQSLFAKLVFLIGDRNLGWVRVK